MKKKQVALILSIGACSLLPGLRLAVKNRGIRADLQRLEREDRETVERIVALRGDREILQQKIFRLDENTTQVRNETAELEKLKQELVTLKSNAVREGQSTITANPDSTSEVIDQWDKRVSSLREYLLKHPTAGTPELAFVPAEYWMSAARGELKTEEDFRRAAAKLRNMAENKFASRIHAALTNYLVANNKQFPPTVTALQPYFDPPVDETLLSKYGVFRRGELYGKGPRENELNIAPVTPIDAEFDNRTVISANDWSFVAPAWKMAK